MIMAFLSRKKIIFVNGCFWHGHDCARGARVPKANRVYWKKKIARNRNRDQTAFQELSEGGWDVQTVWECELKDQDIVAKRIDSFLSA